MSAAELSRGALAIDPARTADAVAAAIRAQVRTTLRKRGVVLGLSGGVDSSVAAALAVRALGPERVLALLMPEGESDPRSLTLGRLVATHLGIASEVEDVSRVLEAAGCYRRRDAAIRNAIPAYGDGWKAKIVLPDVTASDAYRISSVVARAPDGTETRARLRPDDYRQAVAATSFKQRVRKMMEYYHADRLDFAVLGTPNRLEYDQGFFVKNGDGAADLKPLAHLYKTQVYALATYLGVPEEVRARPPTTDTYALEQTQEEFYFSVPYDVMDLCLYAFDRGLPAAAVAPATGLSPEQVGRVYKDIASKRRATRHLHLPPLLVEDATEDATEGAAVGGSPLGGAPVASGGT